jgi:hypothetical protein
MSQCKQKTSPPDNVMGTRAQALGGEGGREKGREGGMR